MKMSFQRDLKWEMVMGKSKFAFKHLLINKGMMKINLLEKLCIQRLRKRIGKLSVRVHLAG
jgi:hypothetical protein